MANGSSGFVLGLTAAALAAVGALAYQASATVPAGFGTPHANASAAPAVSKAPRVRRDPAALPGGSGRGPRVVYSVAGNRVWLVGKRDRIVRTYEVTAGTVDPVPGAYTVRSRSNSVTGTDGTPIEHVVRFASVDGVSVGFSAAVREPKSAPDPGVRTGGIRESRADGMAMWEFATIGVNVVVVP